jgi:hypothetical protein
MRLTDKEAESVRGLLSPSRLYTLEEWRTLYPRRSLWSRLRGLGVGS